MTEEYLEQLATELANKGWRQKDIREFLEAYKVPDDPFIQNGKSQTGERYE